MNTIIESKDHHYSISLELDEKLKAWMDEQINPGGYLEHLIAEDRDRQLYPESEEPLAFPLKPETRMAGDYEIIQAFHIGDREIVLGENQNAAPEDRYMCAYCDRNEIFALYNDVMVSDDFCEISKLYAQRLVEQAEKTRVALNTPKIQGIPNEPLTTADCNPISRADDLNDKIVVIKADVLRREYRKATNQIKLCTGGFGASPNSRGSACFCVDLYSGTTSRYERSDVLGTLEPEQLPKWAGHGLMSYRQEQKQKKVPAKEER